MLDGERQIIERAISGEAQAFGSLYDYYQPQIYRFIYLKVSHREEAEDLTHQVFLNCWRKITEYSFEGFPFSSWLYRIARNEIIDHYRTKKSNDSLELFIEAHPSDLEVEDGLSQMVEADIDILRIKRAIYFLKPIEQDVLILRFVEDLAPGEVAQLVEKTPEAVRLIQHRAIKNLKQILSSNK